MNLESSKVTVNKSQQDIFDFLSEVKNFEKLMPETIDKFENLSDDAFLFALKGMPEIKLKKKEMFPSNKIILGSAGGKLDFSLTANINAIDQTTSEVQLLFNGDFNTMISMMIKGPIGKFIETLASNLPKEV